MNVIGLVLLVSVILLYLKWIFIAVFIPLMSLNAFYRKKRDSLIRKVLAAPYVIMEKYVFRGGCEHFVILNIGLIPSLHLRRFIYKMLGVNIRKNAVIHFKTEIRCPYRLVLGEGTIIGDNCILDARRWLIFGRNVNLSSNVSIYTLQHNHRDPYFRVPDESHYMTVKIGDRAWLGANVIVLPGVTIGEGAVCCAGCVVTKDVEDYSVVAGIPAKEVGKRPKVLRYEFESKKCCRLY